MMPLINRLFVPRKNIKTTADCKLPVDISAGTRIRNTLNFGADQIRVLLFRECERRGRKLLFDSLTAGKNNASTSSTYRSTSTSCSRNGNGLPHECDKEVCDNVNLLSEMVFGTVAMTYRGTLFKIHTLEYPRCIICTKVFPAPDHMIRRNNEKLTDETLAISGKEDDDDDDDDLMKGQSEMKPTAGYTDTLLQRAVLKSDGDIFYSDVHYTADLIIQGLIKKSNQSDKLDKDINEKKTTDSVINPTMESQLSELVNDIGLSTKHSLFDYSISESLCIVADIDNCQVGLISNKLPMYNSLLPVGMSKLVSGMLEPFVYLWTKDKSPLYCFTILESKMREMWLRSEALAQLIMTMDICSINLANLTSVLDIDAADVPLLLAVAATHSPQMFQRIGFTYT